MSGGWNDDRDEQWRGRGPAFEGGQGETRQGGQRPGERWQGAEDRSFGGRDRVFGERDTGAGYNIPRGGRSDSTPDRGGRPAWQDRDYQGVSPGFSHQSDMNRGRSDWRSADDNGVEAAGREAGDFLRRTGRKISNWFSETAQDAGESMGANSHRGRGPKGYKRSDERINEDAHQHLTDDHWLDASDITVSVQDGEVTLAGQVSSRDDKRRAEQIVENISGVDHVQNNLRVKSPMSGSGAMGASGAMGGSGGYSGGSGYQTSGQRTEGDAANGTNATARDQT